MSNCQGKVDAMIKIPTQAVIEFTQSHMLHLT